MNEIALEQDKYLIKITNIIYALHALGVFFFLPMLVGLIMLYIKKDEAKGTWLESHYRWLSRTFWFYLLWLTLGIILTVFVIGIAVLVFNHFWLIYRIVKGWLFLSEKKELA